MSEVEGLPNESYCLLDVQFNQQKYHNEEQAGERIKEPDRLQSQNCDKQDPQKQTLAARSPPLLRWFPARGHHPAQPKG